MQKMRSSKREVCVVIIDNTLEIKAIGGRWEEGGKILSQNHRFANANRGSGMVGNSACFTITQFHERWPDP